MWRPEPRDSGGADYSLFPAGHWGHQSCLKKSYLHSY